MDNRIIHNPHLEVIPDRAGPHYVVLQDALTHNGMMLEEAIQALDNPWTQNHAARVQAWDQQVVEDDAAAAAADLAQQQLHRISRFPQISRCQERRGLKARRRNSR